MTRARQAALAAALAFACRSGESREALVLRVGNRVLDAVHALGRLLP